MKSLLILGAILALQPAVAAPSLRILPLGDSITQGYQSSDTAGYRGPLWTLLKNAGYDVHYVGTAIGGAPTVPDMDVHHEGHGGWGIMGFNGLYEKLNDWCSAIDPPDVILLHVGTNNSTSDILNDMTRLTALLDRLHANEPSAKVILSTVLWRSDNASYYARIVKFNAALPDVVAAQREKGQDICLVDMHAALGKDPANLHEDGLHPNATGYALMAQAWFAKIREIFPTPEDVVNVRTPAAFPVTAAYEDGRLVLGVGFNQRMDEAALANPSYWTFMGGFSAPSILPVQDGRRVRLCYPWACAAVPSQDVTIKVSATSVEVAESLRTYTMTFLAPAYTPPAVDPTADVPDPDVVTFVRVIVSQDRRQLCVEFGENVAKAALTASAWTLEGYVISSVRRSPLDPREAILELQGVLPVGQSVALTGAFVLGETPVRIATAVRAETEATVPLAVFAAVPEAANYRVIKYVAAPHPLKRPWGTLDTDYTLDETRFRRFDFPRVAYLVEVATISGTRWVWSSMDAYTADAAKLGPSSLRRQNEFVTYVGHLLIAAGATGTESVPDVVQGTSLGGSLEMVWSSYAQENVHGVSGADDAVYDWGDACYVGYSVGWGSFSVNDYRHGRTVFNISHFGTGTELSWGLGNQPTGSPDWTINDNAAEFTARRLWVLVRQPDALTDCGVILMGE